MATTEFPFLGKVQAFERDDTATTTENMDNIYRILHLLAKGCGENPYNPDIWQNWENKHADKPKTMSSIKTQKEVKEKDKDGKETIKVKMVDQRLRKPTTFSALGKDSIKVVLIHLILEAQAAANKIKKAHASQAAEIKRIIVEHAQDDENSYNFSTLVYSVCDKVSDSVIMDLFPDDSDYDHKMQGKILHMIPDQNVRAAVSSTFVKFQKLYDTFLGTDLFSTALINSNKPVETKPKTGRGKKATENGNDAKDETPKEKGASGKATGLKQLLHFIMNCNELLPTQDRAPSKIYPYLTQATFALGQHLKSKPKATKAKSTGAKKGASKPRTKAEKEDLVRSVENGVDDDDEDADEDDTNDAKGAASDASGGSEASDASDGSEDDDDDDDDDEDDKTSKAKGKKGVKVEAAPKRGGRGKK